MRRTSSGPSVASSPASCATADWKSETGSAVMRSATLMDSAVTPRWVAPPLWPEKATQGGE